MAETFFAAERAVMLFVQSDVRFVALDWIMVFFTAIGEFGTLWLGLGVGLFIFKKTRRAGFDLIVCVALCWLVNDPLIKNLVQRPRPFDAIPELMTLVDRPGSFSFPSGHACSSFAAAWALRRGFGKKGGWAYVPAALIALSRVYVGVHYPTDVLAGAALGTAGAALVYYLSHRLVRWKFLDAA